MGLAPGQMGLIGSIGLIGMALGAVISGTVADRIGRKKVFTITVLLYSIASAFCALSWNYQSLLVFRFLVGFGLGGELPVAATLVSEYAPSRVRGRFIVLLESFWGLGWIAAACIAYFFIPVYGWRMAFLIGALPALYVCLIRLHMPESVRYLLTRGRVDEALADCPFPGKTAARAVGSLYGRNRNGAGRRQGFVPGIVEKAFHVPDHHALAGLVRHQFQLLWHLYVAAVAGFPAGLYRRQDL